MGKFTLDSFYLIPDTGRYHRLERNRQAPTNLYTIFVEKLELQHIHLWSLIRRRHAHVNVIKIENPEIVVYHRSTVAEDGKESIKRALSKLISGSLKQINIGHVGLHNIQLKYKNGEDTALKSFQLGKMDLVFGDVKLDSSTLSDSSRFLFAKKAWFHLDQGQFFTEDSLYKFSIDGVDLSLNEGKLSVNELRVEPQMNKAAFERYFTFQKDIFRGIAKNIILKGFYPDNIQNNRWYLDTVNIGYFNLNIYLDRQLPLNRSVKPLLQKVIKETDYKVDVKKVAIQDGNLNYKEYNPKSKETGKVSFNNIQGYINHITNDPREIRKNPYCMAQLHSSFMDEGDLHAQFKFNLSDPGHAFIYKGTLYQLKAKTLNPATVPLGMIKVKSGRIHQLRYNFNGNDNGAQGDVDMKYDRLKISILAKDKKTNELKKKGLVSLAANLLVVKEGNVNDSLSKQSAHVNYQRDPERSVFSLMWKSLFQGVKEIVGIDQKKEEKLKAILKNKKKKKDSSLKDKGKNVFKKVTQFLKDAF